MLILYDINNFSLSRYIKVYTYIYVYTIIYTYIYVHHIIFIKINIYYNEINLDSNKI